MRVAGAMAILRRIRENDTNTRTLLFSSMLDTDANRINSRIVHDEIVTKLATKLGLDQARVSPSPHDETSAAIAVAFQFRSRIRSCPTDLQLSKRRSVMCLNHKTCIEYHRLTIMDCTLK